jgi:hypothetical protein
LRLFVDVVDEVSYAEIVQVLCASYDPDAKVWCALEELITQTKDVKVFRYICSVQFIVLFRLCFVYFICLFCFDIDLFYNVFYNVFAHSLLVCAAMLS